MSSPFILIPAHNRRELTLACLATLRTNGDLAECGLIVVDDGSTDGTGAAVRAQFPEAIVLAGDGNLFWTGAIALAMQEAAARGAGLLIWLNDDCRPRPGALRTLCDFLRKTPTAIVGPRCVVAATGTGLTTGFVGRQTFTAGPGETRVVQGLSGFCVGLGAAVAPRFGAPDAANFPHYAGDTAYTLRASRAGAKIVLLGDAVVELVDHREGSAGLRERLRVTESLGDNWRRIFSAANSPYRLRTHFALQQLKYGWVAGRALAAARATAWIIRLLWVFYRRS